MSVEQRRALLAAVLMSGAFLGACNTVEGVGRDIEAAGDAISDEADEEQND